MNVSMRTQNLVVSSSLNASWSILHADVILNGLSVGCILVVRLRVREPLLLVRSLRRRSLRLPLGRDFRYGRRLEAPIR